MSGIELANNYCKQLYTIRCSSSFDNGKASNMVRAAKINASHDVIYGRVLTYCTRTQLSLMNSKEINEETCLTGYFRLLRVRFIASSGFIAYDSIVYCSSS